MAIAGQASCAFDGATTAGDFVVASTSVAGDCSDAGATVPATVQVLGYVLSTNGGAGTYAVDISNIGAMAALNAKAQPGGTAGAIQYNSSNKFGGAVITGIVKGNGTSAPAAAVAADLPATTLATGTSVSLSTPREYYVCTSTCTVTPPVPAAGYEFCVLNDDNVATVITLAALGSSARYENTGRTAYGTAGTGTFISGGAAGDKVCIVGRDSTHYLTTTFNGTDRELMRRFFASLTLIRALAIGSLLGQAQMLSTIDFATTGSAAILLGDIQHRQHSMVW